MLEKVLAYIRREPVRVAVHSLLLSVVAVAVATGKLSADQGDLVTAAVVYILFGAGAEVARSQVTPVKSDE